MSGGESRPVAARPSPPRVVPSQPFASTALAEVMVVILAAIEAGSEVTLAVPPPLVVVEEEREARLPASLGGGRMAHPPGRSQRC